MRQPFRRRSLASRSSAASARRYGPLPCRLLLPCPRSRRQKVVAIALALGLGGIGAHGFYLGNKAMGATLAVMLVGGGGVALVAMCWR